MIQNVQIILNFSKNKKFSHVPKHSLDKEYS